MDEPTPSPPEHAQPPAGASVDPPTEAASGFRARGRARRRARFLRKARELAYRDLGGLVFSLHRFRSRNDDLVLAKLSTLAQIDTELRSIETTLSSREPVTILREAGVTACPRCAAIHSGEDRFCPGCGLPLSGRADLPISGAVSALTTAPQGVPAAVAADAPAAAPQAPAASAVQPVPGAGAEQAVAAAASGASPAPAVPGGSDGAAPATAPDAAEPAPPRADAEPAPRAPTRGSAGRSPLPPSKTTPPAEGPDAGDEQPTQAFPSRAPSS